MLQAVDSASKLPSSAGRQRRLYSSAHERRRTAKSVGTDGSRTPRPHAGLAVNGEGRLRPLVAGLPRIGRQRRVEHQRIDRLPAAKLEHVAETCHERSEPNTLVTRSGDAAESQSRFTMGMGRIMIAGILALALALSGAAWKWNSGGHPAKVAHWGWEPATVDGGGSSEPANGWTW
jgi:hypothetical protein